MEPKFKEVTGMPIVDLKEKGSQIIGILKRKEPGQYGDNYILQVEENGKVEEKMLFTSTVIQTKMSRVEMNKCVRVTYLGEKKGESGRLYKDYKVEVAE